MAHPRFALYSKEACILDCVRMGPEALQRIRHQRSTHRPWRERVAELLRSYE